MGSKYGNIREEELKNRVGKDWFDDFDTAPVIGDIDFTVAVKSDLPLFQQHDEKKKEYLLWAEAKKGTRENINESFVQLILTIGKARTYNDYLPPPFLGAFDAEKIAFIPYVDVVDVFYQNDFNWKVTPSNHKTKEFKELFSLVEDILSKSACIYNYEDNSKELRTFIQSNFKVGKDGVSQIQVNENNFTYIYQRWLQEVEPSIKLDWSLVKKRNILPLDFYLADLLAKDDETIDDVLFVLLKKTLYRYDVRVLESGEINSFTVEFKDGQKAYRKFWNRYDRPPKKMFWDRIVQRRDLLVPQDVRERKGAFFTPPQWVSLSQKYIAMSLGDDWQKKYYVWDCCAGTGNLLAGLTNRNNIFASTLDMQDVKVMKQRIRAGKLNVWENNVFQFDFLNDDFTRLPNVLRDIIGDEEKRKRLVVYINPPYAEAANKRTPNRTGRNRENIAKGTLIWKKYQPKIKAAANELFAQFFIRIYYEIPNCTLAGFSTIRHLNAPNFKFFREHFQYKLLNSFIVPASTFDNVKGKFPIGFFVFDTSIKEKFKETTLDVYKNKTIGKKTIRAVPEKKLLTAWMKAGHDNTNKRWAYLRMLGSDTQNNSGVFLTITPSPNDVNKHLLCNITKHNLIERCIYFSVRHCIACDWDNMNDYYLYPKDTWKKDFDFQSDCLAYTIFHEKNNIRRSGGTNHWIPFLETEVGITCMFESHFLSYFIHGKPIEDGLPMEYDENALPRPINFTAKAQAVLDAGHALWKYYLTQKDVDINASLYDIREFFKGRNEKGTIRNKSENEEFTQLDETLKEKLRALAEKIAPKVYEHGFLMGSADESMR